MQEFGVSSERFDGAVLTDASDLREAARDMGTRAAERGVPLHQLLDHVEQTFLVAHRAPEFAAMRALVESWVEATQRPSVHLGCEDPVTSLSGLSHLRTRLAEMYRAGPDGPHHEHCLVVVELSVLALANELEGSLRALQVAEAMREVFVGDETFSQLTPRRFTVLARRELADPLTLRLLIRVLDDLRGTPPLQARAWVESLPAEQRCAVDLLADLCQ